MVVGYTAEDEGEYIRRVPSSPPRWSATYPPTDGNAWAEQSWARSAVVRQHRRRSAGGDRRSLRLRDADVALIRAVVAANPRTVVVLITAGAVLIDEWRDAVPAVVVGWYTGSEGGLALADVLPARRTWPGGCRSPCRPPRRTCRRSTWTPPRSPTTGGTVSSCSTATATRPPIPLGFGLSYTSFALEDLEVGEPDGEALHARVTLRNTGGRDGRHVVQLYGEPQDTGEDVPGRVLLGFASVAVGAGEAVPVELTASLRPLQRWDGERLVLPATEVTVRAASHAEDASGPAARIRLG